MTSTLDVAEPVPATSPHHGAFTISSGIVGAAAVMVVELIAFKQVGNDSNFGALATMWFFGGLVGLLAGLLLGSRCLEKHPVRAETLAPMVYLLTALAVPFLLWAALLLVVVSALSGMTF